ncbi:MAG: uncharacterized protein A8A55_2473 [Amphiamblys sp. WSBS2006]|nr:MAG: uncharacterized protein A8A55_2473 [Amphiamblys sp. WSBS2006]
MERSDEIIVLDTSSPLRTEESYSSECAGTERQLFMFYHARCADGDAVPGEEPVSGEWFLVVHGFPSMEYTRLFAEMWSQEIKNKTTRQKIIAALELFDRNTFKRLGLGIHARSAEDTISSACVTVGPLSLLSEKYALTRKRPCPADQICSVCEKKTEESLCQCINPSCFFCSHLLCLHAKIAEEDEMLPRFFSCLLCGAGCRWVDFIRFNIFNGTLQQNMKQI